MYDFTRITAWFILTIVVAPWISFCLLDDTFLKINVIIINMDSRIFVIFLKSLLVLLVSSLTVNLYKYIVKKDNMQHYHMVRKRDAFILNNDSVVNLSKLTFSTWKITKFLIYHINHSMLLLQKSRGGCMGPGQKNVVMALPYG